MHNPAPRTHIGVPKSTPETETPGTGPALLGRPATNPQRCEPAPGAPARAPEGNDVGLKTLPPPPTAAPPAHTRGKRKAGPHTELPPLLAAKTGDARLRAPRERLSRI